MPHLLVIELHNSILNIQSNSHFAKVAMVIAAKNDKDCQKSERVRSEKVMYC